MYFEFCVVREAASAEGTAKNGTALSGERGGQYRATAEKRKGRHRTPAGKRRRQHRGPAGEGEGPTESVCKLLRCIYRVQVWMNL